MELPHGQFLPWIAAEFEMSEDAAQRFMAVSVRFSEKPQFAVFRPSILYALAAPSTPEAVVEKAIEKGADTKVADVRDWKADYEAERKARELHRADGYVVGIPLPIHSPPAQSRPDGFIESSAKKNPPGVIAMI